MSCAFVKEDDADAGIAELPERPQSPHPNFVTPAGLAQLEGRLAEQERAREEAWRWRTTLRASCRWPRPSGRSARPQGAHRGGRRHRPGEPAGRPGVLRRDGGGAGRGRPPPRLCDRGRGRGRGGAWQGELDLAAGAGADGCPGGRRGDLAAGLRGTPSWRWSPSAIAEAPGRPASPPLLAGRPETRPGGASACRRPCRPCLRRWR